MPLELPRAALGILRAPPKVLRAALRRLRAPLRLLRAPLRLLRAPLTLAVLGWHLAWGAVALATRAPALIELLNGLVLAVGCGVCVAFLANAGEAMRAERPRADQILVAGIWWSWFAVIEQRVWSVVWRGLGTPMWLANSDFTTHFVSIALLAGLMHLAGPEAIDGRVPARQWVRIGLIVAAGLGGFAVLVVCGLALGGG